jgi:hypothetical protein
VYQDQNNDKPAPGEDVQRDLLRRVSELESLLQEERARSQTTAVAQEPPPSFEEPGIDITSPVAVNHAPSSSIAPDEPPPALSPLPPILNGSQPAQSQSPETTRTEIGEARLTTPAGSRPTTANQATQFHNWPLSPETSRNESESGRDVPLTIPVGHQTATGSLFNLPQITKLIGEYPDDLFFRIESQRSLESQPLSLSPGIQLQRETTDDLVASFFTQVYPSFPIIDHDHFMSLYERFLAVGPAKDSETALCLVILALGKLALHLNVDGVDDPDSNGMEYFSIGLSILTEKWTASFSTEIVLPLGLIYAAFYLCYMIRPLQAWRLVHMASSNLQLTWQQLPRSTMSEEEKQCLGRLCWACFLLECDFIAEFHLPRSGIEILVDGMPFPEFSNGMDRDAFQFLAVCSVRRLLNRIHNSMYARQDQHQVAHTPSPSAFSDHRLASTSPGSTTTLLENLCVELTRQLETWFQSLPEIIKPDLRAPHPRDLHEGWLRLRYWSAKHIINRPCLLIAASACKGDRIPEFVLENSRVCIESCRNYLTTAAYVQTERTQYTWMTDQA